MHSVTILAALCVANMSGSAGSADTAEPLEAGAAALVDAGIASTVAVVAVVELTAGASDEGVQPASTNVSSQGDRRMVRLCTAICGCNDVMSEYGKIVLENPTTGDTAA